MNKIDLFTELSNSHLINDNILTIMSGIPREEFVSEKLKQQAYENHPLSIGKNQTISQPFIVGYMTSVLDVKQNSKVLEVGTGSGYQAAVLSKLCEEIYSIEIKEDLLNNARKVFKKLGITNIITYVCDGNLGLQNFAPYDRIIVTAASNGFVPQELFRQLSPNGILIIPIQKPDGSQILVKITKDENGALNDCEFLMDVSFVPMV